MTEHKLFKTGLREITKNTAVEQEIRDGLNEIGAHIEQAIETLSEKFVVASLAANTIHRPTANGVGWRFLGLIEVSSYRVEHRTGDGTVFGWSVDSRDYQASQETAKGGTRNL